MSRKSNMRRHARRRARERYGITLGDVTKERILNAIRSGVAPAIPGLNKSKRTRVHDVPLDGEIIRVVYDRIHKEIVTCLPRPEAG